MATITPTVGIFNPQLLKVIGPIVFDNVMSDSHEDEAFTADYALENSTIVSDHIVVQPAQLSFEFRLTSQDTSKTAYGLRAALIYNLLVLAFQNRELFTVVSRHRLYTNMAIIKLTAEQRAPYIGSLEGVIGFKQINQPSLLSNLVNVDQVIQDGTQFKGVDGINAGAQGVVDVLPKDALTDNLNTNFGP